MPWVNLYFGAVGPRGLPAPSPLHANPCNPPSPPGTHLQNLIWMHGAAGIAAHTPSQTLLLHAPLGAVEVSDASLVWGCGFSLAIRVVKCMEI